MFVAGVLSLALAFPSAGPESGAEIYAKKCATCHGAQGQGGKDYMKPLLGDLAPLQLAKVVRDTMPEDAPGTLSESDARAVAEYIHGEFYSQVARERHKPPRQALARLTVKQYRYAVADLFGSFADAPALGEPGLKGEYFAARRFNRNNRQLERIDGEIDFDFGKDSPVPGKLEPHEFSIRWTGSAVAPVTGEYEIVARTEHAVRVWINDNDTPLVDAWVKSGSDTEFKGAIHLLAGRAYPLRVEFSKAKQGVDDSKKDKSKRASFPASMRLWWRPPGGALEPIPRRALVTNSAPESYACAVAFPPDDRSLGWERGSAVSKEWDLATTEAAIDAANYAARRLDRLAKVRDGGADRKQKCQAFVRTLAERAFRRPVSEQEAKDRYGDWFAKAGDPADVVKVAAIAILKSPEFLYRELGAAPGDFQAASRLSFALWDSAPDRALLQAAAAGKLRTAEQIRAQAERMLADPRANTKLRDCLLTWCAADQPRDLTKDPKRFPGFDAQAAADLRASLEVQLDAVLRSKESDFRRLLLDEDVYVNARLAKLYGVKSSAGREFVPAKVSAGRAGVLTHPYLMTAFSHSAESSPIHRGVFLARGVLGMALRPPPEAVAPLAPDLHPALTTRERVEMQTKPTACLTCHGAINPLGFALEQFDAVGRFRTQERGKPIDARGHYRDRFGNDREFVGARPLAEFLAQSEECQEAFVEQMFHFLVQQPIRAYGANRLAELRTSFAKSGFHMRRLAVEIAAVAAAQPSRG